MQWSEQGMASSYKFIQKLWTLHNQIKNKIQTEDEKNIDLDFEKFTNQIIAKITNNLEKFNYNVIIANMYETYNYLINFIKAKKNIKNLKNTYIKILTCFSPVIPHFTSQCLSELNSDVEGQWPEYDRSALELDEINFIIQINGKKRAILKTKKNISENDLLKLVKENKNIDKYLTKKEIKKIIFVQNRLMNILLNE